MKEIFKFPGGRFATYTAIDRSLTLKDFCCIKIGMSYEKIIGLLGKPNGLVGSGFQWPFYELSDESCVILLFCQDKEGNYTELFDISIADPSGRTFNLIRSK